MDYRTLKSMKRTHPAWLLLMADHAPLVVSFLHHAFVDPNVRTLPRQELVSKLEDQLFHLREQPGEEAFPKNAEQYLDDWAADERGWLRKYYPVGSDEPHFDITPATEKAIDWLAVLQQQHTFVGTESRLLTVFELLRQIAEGTEIDPEARISELQRRKARIEKEIQRVHDGHLDLMEPTQVKDRFLQMANTARGLLSDFREVEQNFRDLDRAVRERIASWDGGKGALLEKILGERDSITDSDQGRSFGAFWNFLMSPARQDELTSLLNTVFTLATVRDMEPDPRLKRIHYDWLEAGEAAQGTVRRLSEQLRRYLDDRAWREDRRILQIVHEIEQISLAVRDQPPDGDFMALDESAPTIGLPMERPLFSPPSSPMINQNVLLEGDQDIPADALFDQVYVDKAELASRIRRALQARSQISLAELVEDHPLEQGLAELVSYLSLAAEDSDALIDDEQRQQLTWTDADGRQRLATLPLVVFGRQARSGAGMAVP